MPISAICFKSLIMPLRDLTRGKKRKNEKYRTSQTYTEAAARTCFSK